MSWSIFGIAVITRRLSVDLDNEVDDEGREKIIAYASFFRIIL